MKRSLVKYKDLIFVLCGLGIFITTIILHFLPMWEHVKVIKAEKLFYEKKIETLENFATANQDFVSKYKFKQSKYLNLAKCFEKNAADDYVDLLQKLADSSNVSLTVSKAAQQFKNKSSLEINVFDIKAIGEYENILNFIQKLEQHRNIDLENLKFEGNNKGMVIVMGNLKLLFYKIK